MASSPFGENLKRGLMGNPRKAFIIVHKVPPDKKEDSKKLAEKIEEQLGSAGLSALSGALGTDNAHVIQVQFNPSSITFQAAAVPVPAQKLQENVNREVIDQFCRPPSTVMSVQLIFDAVNNADCFTIDKLRLSVGDVLSAPGTIKNIAKDPYTVQPHTNGLLAMAMLTKYKRVSFHWSDLTFTGEVSEARARYTMFSASGRPVRSYVQLQITQEVSGKGDTNYWDNAFNSCFGKEGEAKESGRKSIDQYVGNILNLGF